MTARFLCIQENHMNYFTIAQKAETLFTEKRSDFLGFMAPVSSDKDAVDFIQEIKSGHRKARHHVYAYILRDSNTIRYSDDGEPQGTAGVPVLDVLQKHQLTDVCCVVVRYFGGILLGGGGLVRAYSHSAAITCEAAHIQHMCECVPVILETDYALYGKISYCLPKYGVLETASDFGSQVALELLVRCEVLQKLKQELTDLTSGKIRMTVGNTEYADFSSVR